MQIRIPYLFLVFAACFSIFSCTTKTEVLEEINEEAAEDFLIRQYIVADSVFVADNDSEVDQYFKFGVYMTSTGTTTGEPINPDRKISFGDSIHVTYTGWVMGPEAVPFDSNVLTGVPFEIVLGKTSVIEGWNIALFEMHEHEKTKVVIPSTYGYGVAGSPPSIPGRSSLVFTMQVDSLWKTDEQ
ncbi:FKBP-type peptidyl-prolyl cis-trans isomerase [Flammeovirga yaeyamensis]|uniref:Peptidyl-prolyl cis-trans isomerase n=1 Tax=Flammeovirga yaeyamensis TaxID=367791 RepID=A0AAX1N4I3_9BACT|nr:FKBP-type peptidyl-prolyl cis-trans isomerase [Flammeovirga yaeyamensis]MBB3699714.1 FKBP-type peptidyl-prolyl cis-trans isomerase [Flammeovirga yaeyamensis]NMF36716.1 FKBP-type peptidyl-prolyl cis-trans isomerase [Flammeovirga yaeyamensis]QWG02241.1 FKBP-type peptidyl-prolyl cis-trans isomerase [Flammeovirga yaeyamensis]